MYERYEYLLEELREDEKKREPDKIDVPTAMRYTTELRLKQYKDGDIQEAEFCEFARQRLLRKLARELDEKREQLTAIQFADTLQKLVLVFDKRKPRIKCTVWCYTDKGPCISSSSSVGYGIDLMSSSAAKAMNKQPCILKELYGYKNARLAEGMTDYSNTAGTGHTNADIIGYGTGYDILPEFEQGVGLTSFWKVFNTLGYEVYLDTTMDGSDKGLIETYRIEKRGRHERRD